MDDMSTPTPDSMTSRVTVGIVTKNRPASLRECLESLAVLGDVLADVIVIDDTSDVPIDSALVNLPEAVAGRLRVLRHLHNEGCIVARNTMVREA